MRPIEKALNQVWKLAQKSLETITVNGS